MFQKLDTRLTGAFVFPMAAMKWSPFTLILLMIALPVLGGGPKPVRVAIIFDDGPIAGVTDVLLQVFAKENIHVTFGTEAQKALALPELTLAAAKAGHEIANHSLSHEPPKDLSDGKLEEQIVGAQKLFVEKIGVKPVWYWPPYIAIEPRVIAFSKKAGLTVYPFRKIVSSGDYLKEVSGEEIHKRATTGVVDGSVILFHEWRKESGEQFPSIIAELRKQGCVFLTFSELETALQSAP